MKQLNLVSFAVNVSGTTVSCWLPLRSLPVFFIFVVSAQLILQMSRSEHTFLQCLLRGFHGDALSFSCKKVTKVEIVKHKWTMIHNDSGNPTLPLHDEPRLLFETCRLLRTWTTNAPGYVFGGWPSPIIVIKKHFFKLGFRFYVITMQFVCSG